MDGSAGHTDLMARVPLRAFQPGPRKALRGWTHEGQQEVPVQEQSNPGQRASEPEPVPGRHDGPPLVIHCKLFRELAGDRIEVHTGRDMQSLRMAGVLWVASFDTAEVLRRLQEPGTQAEVVKP